MRKISEEKLKELRRGGVKVFSDGKRIMPDTGAVQEKEPERQEQPARQPVDVTPLILEVLKTQQETQGVMVQYGEALAQCVAELAKPKQKKSWKCSIGRGSNGQINNVDIVER